jgi:hypothetical protein
VSSIYTGLSFFKYAGEATAGLAKQGLLDDLAPELGLFGLSPASLANLTKQGWFKDLGRYYYSFGAGSNLYSAIQDFGKGDTTAGLWDITDFAGNGLNAVKPLVPGWLKSLGVDTAGAELGGELTGFLGSGITLIAALGDAAYESAMEQRQYQADFAQFMQQGLGLSPGLSQALGATANASDGSTALTPLAAYAAQYHMSLAELLHKLDQEPVGKATQFIEEAAGMPTQPDGTYAVSLPTDGYSQVGYHAGQVVPYPASASYSAGIPNQADSLRQLKYWADSLFGKNKLG